MTLSDVSVLQRSGVRLLAGAGLLATAALAAIGAALGSANLGTVLILAVAANLSPSLVALAGRRDLAARLTAGTLAATMPALLVFLLEGHPWQMDGHMYFFVALAALTLLCDWRPIALAATLIALHHLLLLQLAPAAVFAGSGRVSRVAIHALAVVMQFGVLAYLTIRLRALIEGQAAARQESESLAALAESERANAVAALAKARQAEAAAADERLRREALERAVATARERELFALADNFEGTVREVAVGLEGASARLESSARDLNVIAAETGREASDVAEGAAQASVATQAVAAAVRDLTASIALVSASAEQQRRMTLLAEDSTRGGDASVRQLAERTHDIGSFVGEINAIASHTNLLALNATIEAARAGEAGRGFAVVAGEVKTLATQATLATHQIGDMIAAVGSGVEIAVARFRDAADAVGEMAQAAGSIRDSVGAQRDAAARIEASAERAATRAEMIEARIGHVADAASSAEALSLQVREAATTLSDHVRELRCSADRFVGHLRGRGSGAAA